MDSKWWLTSKTIWGILMMVVPAVLQLWGVVPSPEEMTAITDMWPTVVEGLGALLAVYGRWKAALPLRM